MKKKLLVMTAMALMAGYVTSVNAANKQVLGTSVWPLRSLEDHLIEACNPVTAATGAVDNYVATMWIDPGMAVATALDIMATNKQNQKTVDAKKAIQQLKKSLEGGSGGSGSGDSSASDASAAAVYAPELVMTQLEISKSDGTAVFNSTRQAIEDFLFESANDTDCSGAARDCAVNRQNEWLLASVTMASATADKILSLTANQERVKDVGEEGTSSLIKHFQKLAEAFNAQTTPTGMYDIMAAMVLDTHRQVNEANALLGRDLEAQGLRAVRETDVTGLKRSESETEE